MSSLQHTPDRGVDLSPIARNGDLVMLVTLFAQVLAALAIGQHYGSLGLAAAVSTVFVFAGVAAYGMARGTALSSVVLTLSNASLVALHIDLGRGTIEFHFGVFVLLGLLLVYRNWRPIVLAAGFFAVHHILFDRLQAAGVGVYCTPEPDLLKTMMHAIYVVAQTAIEIHLAIGLRRAAVEAAELSAIVRHIDRGDTLCLDVSNVPVSAPTARMLKAAVQKMDAALTDVSVASESIEGAASEVATGTMDLSHRTEEQASNLQQTAASMEELSGAVRSSADTAEEARQVAGSAASTAERGGEAMNKVVDTMAKISKSSRQISEIIGVIDSIAFQTNILALNAAVEAARAGEQGRGFAVVASEVRGLAHRSAQAAKEIKALIDASSNEVETGTHLVGAAGDTMSGMVTQVRQVSDLIAKIAGAAGQQAHGVGQVGQAVTMLDTVTQQNAAFVEEGAAAADSLKQLAVRLNGVVRRFELAPRA